MQQEENDERSDELTAISSIYEDDVFLPSEDDYGGQFVAKLKLPQPFMIHFQGCDDLELATTLSEPPGKFHQIRHLPPIVMNFQLPESYPSISAPLFTLSCKWLSRSQLDVLCKRLDQLWEENADYLKVLNRTPTLTPRTKLMMKIIKIRLLSVDKIKTKRLLNHN
ncbi:RNF14 [Acanthosepion pharaonis]|uniref:RNF14 n=1 Tax=Acanthosepion pharaonis TaxID=158019 RepID=A0A812EV37_ACAPH|nr:RNF14 [Sepia pharaonis]